MFNVTLGYKGPSILKLDAEIRDAYYWFIKCNLYSLNILPLYFLKITVNCIGMASLLYSGSSV